MKNMKSSTRNLLIIGGVILVIAMVLINTYNGLVKENETVESAYSAIQTDLQRRSDLIGNLVGTVQGIADHESGIYEDITSARAGVTGAETPEELADADNELTQALGRFIALTESNPEMKASENFQSLQDELAGTENRIAVSRKDYNDVAKTYNTKVKSFPTNLLAGMFGFDEKEYFEAAEGAQDAPTVEFD